MRNEVKYRSDLAKLGPQTRRQIEQDIERLDESLAAGAPVRLRLGDEPDAEIALPLTTIELIREAMTLERDGRGFLLFAADAEITPEEAAQMLRISTSTLLKKLDSGDLPFQYDGAHRRIPIAAVLAYRSKQQERVQAALQQMRDEADELGIYE